MKLLGGGEDRLLKGYGPLVALVIFFLAMTVLVPTVAPERVTRTINQGSVTGPLGSTPGSGANSSGGVQGLAGGGVGQRAGQGTSSPCPGRTQQVPGDPYSPPCIAFAGDNGGATSRGVDKTTIRVALRQTADPGFAQAEAQLAGATIADTPEDINRTTAGLIDYFNSRFQFYGRKLQAVPYQGQGSQLTEIVGGGQDAANADAIHAASLNVFADATAVTPPYADALAKQKIIALGAPYMSRQWYGDRAPYEWSPTPDCSFLSEMSTDSSVKELFGRPALYAGGSLQGKTRRIAVIAPDSPWYQQCVDAGLARLHQISNFDVAARLSYTIDLSTMSNQAASLVAKLKDQQITSVFVATDPLLLVNLTAKAHEQGYIPEWLVSGVALTDRDIVGQLFDQTEWAHAFGISYLGPEVPQRSTLGYNAYKAVRSDEPSQLVDLIYLQLYMLAVGIEMAGPTLNPATYQQGMFAYPGGSGAFGTMKFGPGKFTPASDAQLIWWDPNHASTYNGKPGAYLSNGQRYKVGTFPAGDPPVFKGG